MAHKTNIALIGASGRMGMAIEAEARKASDKFEITSHITRKGISGELDNAHIVMDFSCADALEDALNLAKKYNLPLLVGSTGHNADQMSMLRDLAICVPVLHAPNTSLGVLSLKKALVNAVQTLNVVEDIHIEDIHHADKIDAPSGTAKMLKDAIDKAAKASFSETRITSIREGETPGTHIVTIKSNGERLVWTHIAESRAIFAAGALGAATWLRKQSKGLYSMDDFGHEKS